MKNFILALLYIVLSVSPVFAQTGAWSGNLEVRGMRIPLVFHLDPAGSTVDSPAQGAKGIPVQVNNGDEGAVSISIPLIGASFNGKYANDRIEGTYTQAGASFPLILTPGENKPKRPQTPDGTGPYTEEEISFINGDAVLKGTLTLPHGYDRNTPVVLMVTGSGLQNRDEEILEHKPFAVIADALAKAGIASLRYDDRGFGESTGDAVNCTTEDLMLDALSGVNKLRERFNKVGVLGHSEGGTIAFMLGADKNVDFIVSLAGMVVSGKETLLDQNRYMLAASGLPEKTVNDYDKILSLIFNNDMDYEKQSEYAELPASLKQNIKTGIPQINTPYMQYFLNLDMRDRLGKIDCPVLALNGTKDTQVFYESNLEALRKGLPAKEYDKIEAVEGVNHMFQHCTTGSTLEYGDIEETISPDVLRTISEFINRLSSR